MINTYNKLLLFVLLLTICFFLNNAFVYQKGTQSRLCVETHLHLVSLPSLSLKLTVTVKFEYIEILLVKNVIA